MSSSSSGRTWQRSALRSISERPAPKGQGMRHCRRKDNEKMNTELKTAMEMVEKEKNISQDTLFDAIGQALVTACKNSFGRTENIKVSIDRDTCDYRVYAEKTIVPTEEDVEDSQTQISQEEAAKLHLLGEVGDVVQVDINSQSFGRIATQIAKNVILQKIREEERNSVYNYYKEKIHTVMNGTVAHEMGHGFAINLGRAEGILNDKEMVPNETLHVNDRVKVYVLDVRLSNHGSTRILVSRTHPDLVKCLFEEEVQEIHDGIVEIRSIAREAGSRTKIAVSSNDPNVDPVGACVGLNGSRVNSIVDQLGGEKIDIVSWDENPGNFIQNALSPARIIAVFADPMEKTAKVVVPNYQLSLAIGREGQNARLAARLTGYKIDIKDEDQAKVTPGFRYEDYMDSDDEEVEYVNSDGYLVDENGELLLDENGEPIPADMEEEGYEDEAPEEGAAPAEDAPAEETPAEEDAPEGENTPEA